MFATPAFAQAANGAAASGPMSMLPSFGLMLMLVVLFYFMLIRPQQKRAKEHAAKINAVKRGDTVVLSNGVIGKVVRVEEQEVGLEIAQGVTVKVVKTYIGEVRSKGEPAPANDAKN